MSDKASQLEVRERINETTLCPVCRRSVPWNTLQRHLENHITALSKGERAWCARCCIHLRPVDYLPHILKKHGLAQWCLAQLQRLVGNSGSSYPSAPIPGSIDCHICGVTVGIHKLDRHFVRHRIAAKKQDGIAYVRCPHCESIVEKGNLANHLSKIHNDPGGKDAWILCPECQAKLKRHELNNHLAHCHALRPERGKHPMASAAARVGRFVRHRRSCSTLVFDGMNLLRHDGADKPQLKYITAIVIGMIEADCIDFLIIFDANTIEVLSQSPAYGGSAVFKTLIELFPDHICLTPRGVRADDLVLSETDRLGAIAISNDRYRDYADRYPWVADSNRLKRFHVSDNAIQFAGRNLIHQPGSLNDHLKRLKKLSRRIYGPSG